MKYDAWDFVTQFYPNYYLSDEIAENDDLHKILDKEDDEDSDAYKLKYELFPEWDELSEEGQQIAARILVSESDLDIYQKAIENFLKNPKYGFFVSHKSGEHTNIVCLDHNEFEDSARKTLYDLFDNSNELQLFIEKAKEATQTFKEFPDGTWVSIQKQ